MKRARLFIFSASLCLSLIPLLVDFFALCLQAIVAEGDTVRTIVKFISQEPPKGREAAVSMLFELSKSEALCEKIGSVRGAIILLVGLTSSKSEMVSTVEKADKTLVNLERSEENVRQMATNGRLQPLLSKLLQGDFNKPLPSLPIFSINMDSLSWLNI